MKEKIGRGRIKVCHMSSVHPRFAEPRIFFNECLSLVKAGYEVSFVVADGDGYASRDGISIIDVGKARTRISRVICKTFQVMISALRTNAKLFHFHDPELIVPALMMRLLGKKVIYDAHEDVPQQMKIKDYLPGPVRSIASAGMTVLERLSAPLLSHVIIANPQMRKRYKSYTDRWTLICNYPKLEEFKEVTAWDRKKHEICYVGSLSKVRGVLEMIEASMRADIRLNLAGPFASSNLEQKARASPGWRRVSYYGSVERSGLAKVLNRSRIGLACLHFTPNHKQALPTKMFEYMAAGLPVIVSRIPQWKKIVDKHKCGISVDPLDVDEIVAAINRLTTNSEVARRMGERGRKAAFSQYNWAMEEIKLIRLYDDLTEGNRNET